MPLHAPRRVRPRASMRLRGKKMVVIGCGAQGLNQGLNLRDSGLDVSYALRDASHRSSSANRGRMPPRTASRSGPTKSCCPTADVVLEPDTRQAAHQRREHDHADDEARLVPACRTRTASTSSRRACRCVTTSPSSWWPPSAQAPRSAPSTSAASVCRP